MPRIQEVIEAEAELVFVQDSLRPVFDERDAVGARLTAIETRIREALQAPQAIVDAAHAEQARCLTKWVSRSKNNFERYLLRREGCSSLSWDRRAWLRLMIWNDGEWHWTLDYHLSGRPNAGVQRVRIETLIALTDKTPVEAICAVADSKLVSEGWRLTDLDNGDEHEYEHESNT